MAKVNQRFRKTHSAALVIAAVISSQGYAAEKTNTATPTDTMVVTASGFQQRIQDSAASISVVTREQIENKAYCNERCNSDPHPTPEIRSRG